MSVMTTGQFGRLVVPGLRKIVGLAQERYQSRIPDLFNMDVSRRAYEESLTMAGFGTIPDKNEGADAAEVEAKQGFYKQIGHVVRSAIFVYTREMKRKDLYGVFTGTNGKMMMDFVAAFHETKEIAASVIYNTGSATTNFTVGDGGAWFANDHALEKGGTYSNLLTGADFAEASAQAMINLVDHTPDGAGKLCNWKLSKFLFPSQGRFTARKVIDSAYEPSTGNNAVNSLQGEGLSHMSWPYLTDEDAFWGLVGDLSRIDVTMFEATPLEFAVNGAFRSDNTEIKGLEEYSFFVNDWRGVAFNPGG